MTENKQNTPNPDTMLQSCGKLVMYGCAGVALSAITALTAAALIATMRVPVMALMILGGGALAYWAAPETLTAPFRGIGHCFNQAGRAAKNIVRKTSRTVKPPVCTN